MLVVDIPDQRVDTAKTDTDTPQTSELNQLLAQLDIASLKTEHGSRSTRHLGMQLVLRMCLQSRVVHLKLVRLQEICNLDRIGLLTIHANSQRLDSSHQQPAVEWAKTNSRCVDRKVDFLIKRRRK